MYPLEWFEKMFVHFLWLNNNNQVCKWNMLLGLNIFKILFIIHVLCSTTSLWIPTLRLHHPILWNCWLTNLENVGFLMVLILHISLKSNNNPHEHIKGFQIRFWNMCKLPMLLLFPLHPCFLLMTNLSIFLLLLW
jgi:hypothetical protein